MTEPNEDPILEAVAATIADGLPVDWESLIAEHPEIANDLRELQVLQGVDGARRGVGPEQKGGKGSP
jgi:hypothetical protein